MFVYWGYGELIMPLAQCHSDAMDRVAEIFTQARLTLLIMILLSIITQAKVKKEKKSNISKNNSIQII